MKKSSVRSKHFRPTIFKLMATEEKLTAASGLATIMEVFDQSALADGFKAALPERSIKNKRSTGSYRLGLIQLNSFIFGHDCLDDLVAPRTMGDFLRDFLPENLNRMNAYLSTMSRAIRRQLIEVLPKEYKPSHALTIDMDSTDHQQHGKKMEGLAYNYKGTWGLYCEVAYDELGFCHGVTLSAG